MLEKQYFKATAGSTRQVLLNFFKSYAMKKANNRSKAFEKQLIDFLHTIGDNLYALRMSRKATLKTVARAIKISPGRLSKIEKGLCPHCRFGVLVRLCEYYEIKLADVATKGKFKVRKDKPTTQRKPQRKRSKLNIQ
jgi:DNA-binding Xre family transcriptional regulator